MATEIRMEKNDYRMLSPNRDLKHCMVPMMRGAIQMTEIMVDSDHKKLVALGELAMALSDAANEAKYETTGIVPDVLARAVEKLQDIDPEVQLLLFRNFLVVALARYIAGLRETTTMEILGEKDIFDVSVVAGMAAFLPKDARDVFAERMRDRKCWKGLDALGLFQEYTIPEVPKEALKKEYKKDEPHKSS